MTPKYHRTLTVEKWRGFSFGRQVLMVANELGRAGSAMTAGDPAEVKRCYERALELVCFTLEVAPRRRPLRRELCRFKEVLASLYVSDHPSIHDNQIAQGVLISLSPEAFAMLHPRQTQ